MIPLPNERLLEVLVAERDVEWEIVGNERENLSWFKTPPSPKIIRLPDLVVKVLANEEIRERARVDKNVEGLKRYRREKRDGTRRDRNRVLEIHHIERIHPRTHGLTGVFGLSDRGAC